MLKLIEPEQLVDFGGESLSLRYTPRVRLRDGALVAVQPHVFSYTADGAQGTVPAFDWMFETALDDLSEWDLLRVSPDRLIIPLTDRQLADGQFLVRLADGLSERAVDGCAIQLQIRHSSAREHYLAAADVVRAGLCVEITDVIADAQALAMLVQLGPASLHVASPSEEVIQRVGEAAGLIDAFVTASGVKTAAEAGMLAALGCHEASGPLFGDAVDLTETTLLLRNQGRPTFKF